MKTKPVIVYLTCLLFIATLCLKVFPARAQQPNQPSSMLVFEYASVRFMAEKTSIVWPDGKVESVMELAGKVKYPNGEFYPKGSDYRMYWLTVAMNLMGKKGFEFAHMNGDDVVMKRAVSK